MLTSRLDAPRPWTGIAAARLHDRIAAIQATVAQSPIAATTLCRLLRIGAGMTARDAVAVESLAYSTLLDGAEFAHWLETRKSSPVPNEEGPFVTMAREGDDVTIQLARPASRNPMCANMRDALFEALAAVLDDPGNPRVRIEGLGNCFSTGACSPSSARRRTSRLRTWCEPPVPAPCCSTRWASGLKWC